MNDLGQQIKTARKAKKWTQAELAEMAGIDRTTMGSIERGSYRDIGIRKVARVAELIGLQLILVEENLPTLDDLNADSPVDNSFQPWQEPEMETRTASEDVDGEAG
jgi:transcriptional regulator with XRE-family HTH domain